MARDLFARPQNLLMNLMRVQLRTKHPESKIGHDQKYLIRVKVRTQNPGSKIGTLRQLHILDPQIASYFESLFSSLFWTLKQVLIWGPQKQVSVVDLGLNFLIQRSLKVHQGVPIMVHIGSLVQWLNHTLILTFVTCFIVTIIRILITFYLKLKLHV